MSIRRTIDVQEGGPMIKGETRDVICLNHKIKAQISFTAKFEAEQIVKEFVTYLVGIEKL